MENYSEKLTKCKTYHHTCRPTNAIHRLWYFHTFLLEERFFFISQLQTYSKDSIYVYLFNKYVLNTYYVSWTELKANIFMIWGDSTYFINVYTHKVLHWCKWCKTLIFLIHWKTELDYRETSLKSIYIWIAYISCSLKVIA